MIKEEMEALNCQEILTPFFLRCGLETIAVEGSTGLAGEISCSRFMVRSESGDDVVFQCPGCGYTADRNTATFKEPCGEISQESKFEIEKIHTPGITTIDDLCEFLKTTKDMIIKSLVYVADDDRPVMALIRGDRELNEYKLCRKMKLKTLRMASPEQIEDFTGGSVGFSGPLGIEGSSIIADNEIKFMINAIAGANETDYHYENVNPGRDFNPSCFGQIRFAEKLDLCSRCGEMMDNSKVVEIGNVSRMGTEFSKLMRASFVDEDGIEKYFFKQMKFYYLILSRLPTKS